MATYMTYMGFFFEILLLQFYCFHSSQFSKAVDNFFEEVKEMDCYITGTNFQSSVKSGSCVCYNDYRGSDCGIPAKVRH